MVLFRPVLFAGPISSGPISTGPKSPPFLAMPQSQSSKSSAPNSSAPCPFLGVVLLAKVIKITSLGILMTSKYSHSLVLDKKKIQELPVTFVELPSLGKSYAAVTFIPNLIIYGGKWLPSVYCGRFAF